MQQYERAVADSRYTLLILSPAFLADVWAAYANTLSSHLSVNQQRPRLIPLIYAACDLSLGIDALKKLDCTTPQGYTASLADLRALLSQPLDAPPAPPPQAGPSHTGVGDASAFIHEKTRGLVGRDWVCTAVQAFVQDPQRSSGYFVLSGEPGIGKSSIAAELVRRFGWAHHFNRRTAGIVTCVTAWRNLAAQLLSRHPLPLRHPPLDRPNDAFDGAYVNDLLTMVSRALPPGQREVIVIDALDEADRTGLPAGANVLLLPSVLPPGLFLIVTLRPDQNDKRRVDTSHLQIEEGRHDFPLYEDDAGNLDDLRRYVAARIASVPAARACSCLQVTPTEQLSRANQVFLARAAAESTEAVKGQPPQTTQRLRVLHALKGTPGESFVLTRAAGQQSTCDRIFTAEEVAVVFAGEKDSVSLCSGNQPLPLQLPRLAELLRAAGATQEVPLCRPSNRRSRWGRLTTTSAVSGRARLIAPV